MTLQKCGKIKFISSDEGIESEKVKERKYATKRTKRSGAFEILALRLVLIYEILSRLPIDTILSCKCICKTFLQIVTDPYFIEKQHSIDHRMIVVDKFPPVNLSTCLMPDLENPFQGHYKSLNSWKTFLMPKSIAEEGSRGSHLFGSCNGLVGVCFATADGGYVYYICNPILAEYMALALPTDPRGLHLVSFSFCPKPKQYKVIQFLRDGKKPYCNILTLGHSSWRRINNVPYPCSGLISIGPSFNGYLHWTTGKIKTEEWICSLNLENEEIKYWPPSQRHINQDLREWMSQINFAVFDGSFCVSYFFSDSLGRHQFEICAMKDYGVKESWTKVVVLNIDSDRNPVEAMVRLLNNGIVLLGRYNECLVYYDTRKGIKKTIMAKGSYDALDYFLSLISLKNIVGPEKVEIARHSEKVEIARRSEKVEIARRSEKVEIAQRSEKVEIARRSEKVEITRRRRLSQFLS